MRGVGGLLNLCQGGTCICDHQQNNVLYCYGEVSRQSQVVKMSDIFPLTRWCWRSLICEMVTPALHLSWSTSTLCSLPSWWQSLTCCSSCAHHLHLSNSHNPFTKVTVTLLLLFMLLILLSIRSTLASLKHQVKIAHWFAEFCVSYFACFPVSPFSWIKLI